MTNKKRWSTILHKPGEKYATGKYGALLLACCSVAAVFTVGNAGAMVTGSCSNCHTMHNSQDGAALSSQPQNYLLADDCVGCHSSSGPETIVTLGSTRIPIVFNTTAYPAQPLAGGNFYKVSLGGAANDVYGHNVLGVSGQDNNLARAPGDTQGGCGCHGTLATDDGLHKDRGRRGCEACHQFTKHHGTDPPDGEPETAASGWFRYLGGHDVSGRYVEGIEDPDWEKTPSATAHNVYKGETTHYNTEYQTPTGLADNQSINAFCTGCHIAFHDFIGNGTSPWIRHPSDIVLPATGEYAAYNPLTDYDPSVPVAWDNPSVPVREEAVVMCLSCHRAHGSEHPDMLRWDYDSTIANGGVNSTGCFRCHSSKDE